MRGGPGTVRIGILAAAFCCVPAGAGGATPADFQPERCGPPPASLPAANLVTASQLILVGVARDPDGRLEREARRASPDYVELPIEVVEVLHGDPRPAGIVLRIYPRDDAARPPVRALVRSLGRPAIFHLLHVDVGPAGYYFAGDSPDALAGADPAAADAARREIARQGAILAAWRPDPAWPHFEAVRGLVGELASVRRGPENERLRQSAIFRRIEALGPAAVPAIVAHLDDRRPLAFPQIALNNNFPGAFEGVRHYGPDLIVDALAAILNQLTGFSFSQTYNGGSDRERDAEVAGWRVYAMDVACGHRPLSSLGGAG